MNEASKLHFPTWYVQGRTLELSDVKKAKLQKSRVLPFTNKQFISFIVPV
jgi:hypothetical protein